MNDGASATAVAAHTPTTFFLSFLSASLYVSKTGDIEIGCVVTRDVVGWSVVGCHARALWPNGAS